MWPSSLANANSLNLHSINDLINTILYDSLNNINPYNSNWLRTNADICMAKTNYCDAFKFYLQIIVCETRNFFKSKTTAKMPANAQQQIRSVNRRDELGEDKYMDEKLVKTMIKILSNLNKHTQAAILSQYITQNNDYSNAFRYLQEGSVIQPTNDEMDLLYECVWDITLLEYFTNLNSIRGFLNKKNLCVKLCSSQGINPSNPIEIFQKTVESKKNLFLQKLINHYFLI
jgi:integrator complex subunit 8